MQLKKQRRSMIVAQQDETHVYAGDTGYIVIAQTDEYGEESFVFIDPMHAEAICNAILSKVDIAEQNRKEWIEEEKNAS
jgi:uncharacterized protein YpmB